MQLNRLEEGIARLCVPFENLYTSVFVLTEGEGCMLFDAATTKSDTESITVPALQQAGLTPQIIVCSHMHGDHAGGLPSLLNAYPLAQVACFDTAVSYGDKTVHPADGDVLLGRFEVLNLKGHTKDCLALWDQKTSTLISGDCLQLQGIGRYGTAFVSYADYMATIDRVRALRPHRIIASHEYIPFGSSALGKTAVSAYLDECARAAREIADFAAAHASLSPDQQAELFARLYPHRPTVGSYMFDVVRSTK